MFALNPQSNIFAIRRRLSESSLASRSVEENEKERKCLSRKTTEMDLNRGRKPEEPPGFCQCPLYYLAQHKNGTSRLNVVEKLKPALTHYRKALPHNK